MDLAPLEAIVKIANILRKMKFQGVVRKVRTRAALNLFKQLHENVIHDSRALGECMTEWDIYQTETTALAQNVCTSSRQLMSDLLELNPDFLHCCFKVIVQPSNATKSFENSEVVTWIRSKPLDDRPLEPNPHPVVKNTVWSALLGCYDGVYNWGGSKGERTYNCFSCNNLSTHDDFQNSRGNWRESYNAALVFPINFLTYSDKGRPFKNVIGFLAFDSPKTDAFFNVPDIFDYRDHSEKRSEYTNLLGKSTAFQIGAVIADTLGVFLKGPYSKNAEASNSK